MSIESFVLQSESYEDASTFTQTSAAAAAASKTAAPPVSVRRNSRSGVCTLRAQAVRPENGDGDGRLLESPSVLAVSLPADVGRSLDRCHLDLLPSGSVQQLRTASGRFLPISLPDRKRGASAEASRAALGRGRRRFGQARIAQRFPEQVDRHRQAGNL